MRSDHHSLREPHGADASRARERLESRLLRALLSGESLRLTRSKMDRFRRLAAGDIGNSSRL
jgi:hypothetical protein